MGDVLIILWRCARSQALKDRREAERLLQAALHGHGHVMSLDNGAPVDDANAGPFFEQRAGSNSEGGGAPSEEGSGSFEEVGRTNPTTQG
jgi:hypothetical protein